MDNKMLSEALISMLGAGNVRTGELMKTHTTFRIGGAADYYVTPQAEKQIADVIAFLKKSDIKYIVIGNGSNILVSDEGFRGVVVELGDGFSDYEFLQDSQDNSDEVLVKASAGMKLTRLGNQLAANGIAGFEFATGIPGCIGGAVRMNAGAYGGEFKDILVSAKVIDDEGVIRELSADELELGYRTSIVAKSNMIVLEVTLKLRKGEPDIIRNNISELAAKRSHLSILVPEAHLKDRKDILQQSLLRMQVLRVVQEVAHRYRRSMPDSLSIRAMQLRRMYASLRIILRVKLWKSSVSGWNWKL
jgi:UDP-N-acetylmuramate dehydrogenase